MGSFDESKAWATSCTRHTTGRVCVVNKTRAYHRQQAPPLPPGSLGPLKRMFAYTSVSCCADDSRPTSTSTCRRQHTHRAAAFIVDKSKRRRAHTHIERERGIDCQMDAVPKGPQHARTQPQHAEHSLDYNSTCQVLVARQTSACVAQHWGRPLHGQAARARPSTHTHTRWPPLLGPACALLQHRLPAHLHQLVHFVCWVRRRHAGQSCCLNNHVRVVNALDLGRPGVCVCVRGGGMEGSGTVG